MERCNQHVAGVAVDKQVHVPLAVAHFHIGEFSRLPVPALVFFAQRHIAQGFGKQNGVFGVNGRFAGFGVKHIAGHAQKVADVQVRFSARANTPSGKASFLKYTCARPAHIQNVQKGGLAHPAQGGNAPADTNGLVFQLREFVADGRSFAWVRS